MFPSQIFAKIFCNRAVMGRPSLVSVSCHFLSVFAVRRWVEIFVSEKQAMAYFLSLKIIRSTESCQNSWTCFLYVKTQLLHSTVSFNCFEYWTLYWFTGCLNLEPCKITFSKVSSQHQNGLPKRDVEDCWPLVPDFRKKEKISSCVLKLEPVSPCVSVFLPVFIPFICYLRL